MKAVFAGLMFILGCYIAYPGLIPAQADAVPSVVINELAWAGSSLSSTDEWIELRNTTDAPVDISGWIITKNTTGTDQAMVTLPPATSITAGGYFLIAHLTIESSVLNIAPNIPGANITLSNSALLIKLWSGPISDPGNLIDTAWDGTAPPPHGNTVKASLERDDDLAGWHEAVAAVNLDAKVIDLGTPLAPNSHIAVLPTVTSISPVSGLIGSAFNVDSITGTGFSLTPPPTVTLQLGNQSVTATEVEVESPERISKAKFGTTGLSEGKWDVVVTNPDGLSATLTEAVELREPPPTHDLTATIWINEIYPRPNTTANDEFIELYNFGDKTVNLLDWQLDDIADGGSTPYKFGEINLPPKGFKTLYKPESKLTMNDSADTVRLIQPDGFLLDSTSYTEAPKGSTWSRFTDGFKWTILPTPNQTNTLREPVVTPPPPTETRDFEPDDAVLGTITYAPGAIIINELLPNPKVGEEFIELLNTTNQAIDLSGWTLKDATGKSHELKTGDVFIQDLGGLQPGKYAVVDGAHSHIALNNSGGEKLQLFDPSGQLVFEMSYPDKAPSDAAYAYDGKNWWWTPTPTPGKQNQIEISEVEANPNIEVVTPTILPVTGSSTRKSLGILMMGVSLAGMIFWYRKRNDKTRHYYS